MFREMFSTGGCVYEGWDTGLYGDYTASNIQEWGKQIELNKYVCLKAEREERRKKEEMEQKRLEVDRIIRNGKATVVIWKDGEKTIVSRAEDEAESTYAAFTAAVAIRLYGNNSKLKKMLEQKTVEQKPRKKVKA